MKTTVKQIEIPVVGGTERIDFSDFASKDSLSGLAQEASLSAAKREIISAVENAEPDLSSVAKESSLNSAKNEIIEAVNNSLSQYDVMLSTQLESIIG